MIKTVKRTNTYCLIIELIQLQRSVARGGSDQGANFDPAYIRKEACTIIKPLGGTRPSSRNTTIPSTNFANYFLCNILSILIL